MAPKEGGGDVIEFDGGEEYGEKNDLGPMTAAASSQSESTGVMVGGGGAGV